VAGELALTVAGERGLYVTVGPEAVDEGVNRRVQALSRTLRQWPLPGLSEVVPGYWNLYLEFAGARPPLAALRRRMETAGESLDDASPPLREHLVPVIYDGPDLAEAARLTGLSPGEVIHRHSATPYRVFALGFTPGFAYLGTADAALQLPRHDTPRPVAAGSVAVAGAQTGIYPAAGPGGWRVLGRTNLPLFDRAAGLPLLQPGDTVRFRPVASLPALTAAPAPVIEQGGVPLLCVLEPGWLDTIQDLGRRGVGMLGLAMAGALDGRGLRHANALLGNDPGAPGLEITLRGPLLEVMRPTVLGLAGGKDGPRAFRLRRGERLDLREPGPGARAYLAAPGGLCAWRVHGSASTDLRAGIGGLQGRSLRQGDLIFASERVPSVVARQSGLLPLQGEETVLRVLPGPQAGLFPASAWRRLVGSIFRVTAADRMGMRLEGPAIEAERHEVVSEAVPLGSIQVPPDGQPILLLNDRGTLGGYVKVAIVVARDLPRAGQLREGQRVRFRSAF
jgi:KipI family sensor histidine kinase inhibitor